MKKIRQGLSGENFNTLAWKMGKLAFLMLHSGQNWSSQFDHCVLKKIWQGLCSENFSSLTWKMAKIVFLMLHSGQKWSKVILKQIWPLCFEKDQARVLWWKIQLSSMKNGKVSIFDVAQWSKMAESKFEKNDHCVLKKSEREVYGENFSFLVWIMAKLAFLMLHSGQKWSKVSLKKNWPLHSVLRCGNIDFSVKSYHETRLKNE